jgi:subtilisin family serine protease
LLAAVLLLALLSGSVLAGPTHQRAAVHPKVWEALKADGEAQVLVVLRAQADLSGADALPTKEAKGRYVYEKLRSVAEQTQRSLRSTLDAQGADYQAFYIVNALKVRARSVVVHFLAARSDVGHILPNPWVKGVPDPLPGGADALAPQGVETNLERVHADDAWALGYTGQGIVVGGQDTGYQWTHPALKDQYRGWDGELPHHDYNWHDAIHEDNPHTSGGNPCGYDSPAPCDDHGHGTHTMGIAVGDDGQGNQIGMAPGARWIACRNMEQGWGTPATYMECFEFFLAPYPVNGASADGDPAMAPHVVNNSWSCPPSEGCSADTLELAVDALRQAGIVVVASTGNHGSGCSTVDNPPAVYDQTLSVGAFSHSTGQIASFSSRGPVNYGGDVYRKPDIAAPGVSVRSSTVGDSYGRKSGTSMAAPHVAGAVALLLSAAPYFAGDVDAIEQILTMTAEPRTTTQGCGGDSPDDVPNNVWGWGVLNVQDAVELVPRHNPSLWTAETRELPAGLLLGRVIDAEDGAPITAAQVIANLDVRPGAGAEATTDARGYYALTLPAATYKVRARAAGYAWHVITNVEVISGQLTVLGFSIVPAYQVHLPFVVKDL